MNNTVNRVIELAKKDIYQDMDGFYYFYPSRPGHFNEYTLRIIADYLEKLNKPWNDEIEQYFAENP